MLFSFKQTKKTKTKKCFKSFFEILTLKHKIIITLTKINTDLFVECDNHLFPAIYIGTEFWHSLAKDIIK